MKKILPGKGKKAGKTERKKALPPERAAVKRQTGYLGEVAGAEKRTAEIEKLKGKLEIYENNFHRIEAGMEKLAQEIGDIRRMILDREEGMKNMDIDFERVKKVMESVEPEKFSKAVEKMAARLEVDENRLERSEGMFSQLKEDIKMIKDVFSKIRSTETLLDSLSEMDSKLAKVKETEQFMERVAGKTENVYYQFSKDVSDMRKKVAAVERVEEMLKEVIKEVDKINLLLKSEGAPESIKKKIGSMLAAKENLSFKAAYELKEQRERLESRVKELDSVRERLERFEKTVRELASSQNAAAESVSLLANEYETVRKKLDGLSSAERKAKDAEALQPLSLRLEELAGRLESVEKRTEKQASQPAEGNRQFAESLEMELQGIAERMNSLDQKLAGADINALKETLNAVAEKNRQLEKMISEIAL